MQRVVLVGSQGSGKTTLVHALKGEIYWPHERPTVCADVSASASSLFYDMSGDPGYESMQESFFPNQIDVLLITIDLRCSVESLEVALKYYQLLRRAKTILFVGTKKDRAPCAANFVVPRSYIEVSAKTGQGVPELIRRIAPIVPPIPPSSPSSRSCSCLCTLL